MGKLKTKSVLLLAAVLGAGLLLSPCDGMAISVNDVTSRSAGVNVTDVVNGVNIKSDARNNVIKWSSYNVAQTQTVQYDLNNYLNLIGGNAPSKIDGKIMGDGNIYLINPNGVIFGDNSSVNVGNLYVSTSPLDQGAVKAFKTSGADPLANSATKALGDIVNLGNMHANSVYLEGDNVTLTSESVKDVTEAVVRAQGDINGCVADGEMPATEVNNDQFKNNPDATTVRNIKWQDLAGHERNDVTSYWQIRNVCELQNMKNNLSANYALVTDIDASSTESWDGGFQPVGTTTAFEEYNSAYTGKFDGLNHKINGLFINRPTEDYVGLFGFTHNAEVKNLSISGQIVGRSYVGSIAGYNDAGTIKNVTNEGDVSGMYVGGLVGYNSDGRVSGVNKGDVLGKALLWEYVRDEFGHVILDYYGTAMYFEKVSLADYAGGLVGYSGRRYSVPGPELGVVTGTNFGKVAGNNFVGGSCGEQ